jgi:hypothetical protein
MNIAWWHSFRHPQQDIAAGGDGRRAQVACLCGNPAEPWTWDDPHQPRRGLCPGGAAGCLPVSSLRRDRGPSGLRAAMTEDWTANSPHTGHNDGTHRLYKAHVLGLAELPGWVLTAPETETIRRSSRPRPARNRAAPGGSP